MAGWPGRRCSSCAFDGTDGTVLVEHDFADRPVCENDVIGITGDLELAWLE